MMTPQEFALCQQVLQYLTSSELSDKNYLFLEPVDTSLFDTYLQYVKNPMDLGTIATLLNSDPKSSKYESADQVFSDITLCFENAVLFHTDKPENRWIIKLAKDMIRITQREQKKIMKKLEETSAGEAGRMNTKSLREESSTTLPLVEDGEIKTMEKTVSVNKGGKQGKVKISLPLSKNAPTNKNEDPSVSTTVGHVVPAAKAATTTKTTLSRGKQMPKSVLDAGTTIHTTVSSSTSVTSTTVSQAPPVAPKIRLNLGSKKVLPTSQQNTIVSTGSHHILDHSGDTSVLETVGRQLSITQGHSSKTSRRLPLQPKTSDPTTTQPGSSVMDHFSLGMSITNVDALFDSTLPVSTVPMTQIVKESCYKVLSGLIRRNSTNANWFVKPVNDPRIVDDYKAKIPCPMDLGTIGTKLDKNQYKTIADFVIDVRKVFGNCLRYNSEATNPLRVIAREMLISAEALMNYFLKTGPGNVSPYPLLLSCWRKVVDTLDHVLTLTTSDGHLIAHYFLHPPSYYFGGTYPSDYLEKITSPIDLGTITSKLIEGSYLNLDDVRRDIQLIPANCSLYYRDKEGQEKENSMIMIGQAQKVSQILLGKIQPLTLDRFNAGSKNLVDVKKPPQHVLIRVMKELRATSFTDKFTKLSEPATLQFEEPVDTTIFTDYLQYVETPMDLSLIDRKIDADAYRTPEDFEYDVNLVFKNCEAYNVPKRNTHIVALARHCVKTFRKLFLTIMSSWEAPPNKQSVDLETFEPSSSKSMDIGAEPLSKKIKLERGIKSAIGPRKSLSQMHLITNPATTSTGISRLTSIQKTSNKDIASRENAPRILKIKMDGPVPLHVAIAQIKDSFSTRRLHKDLESWEGACSRFYRELMRHPWLSASRPKFIFSCPVPILFPELKEAYSAKIVKPMDLTTIECKLLQGGLYKSPQDMTDDVALVFSNAVTFNKAGYELGEPLSCAYYDASRHLLRFSRWLSLDCFDQYLIDDMHDDGAKQIGPIPSWKLRRSYWKDAKEEMEEIVFNQVIDSSDDSRFWMETECEKLLKCLRHQSDCKKMEFFLDSIYPADYCAFISKPMDWKSCERTLQQSKYRTFGDLIRDLRLIFSNALIYNGRAKGTDSVSGRAYDAAVYMSGKLESYISKMLITVSDKLLRERIDEMILDREQQAAEKAEVTRLRNEWQLQRDRMRTSELERKSSDNAHERSSDNKAYMINIRNFEFSHYDDEPPSHDLAQQEIAAQHRLLLEKQLVDRANMQRLSVDIGRKVYQNLIERSKAILSARSLVTATREKDPSNFQSDAVPCVHVDRAEVDIKKMSVSVTDRPILKMKITSKTKTRMYKAIKPPSLFDD